MRDSNDSPLSYAQIPIYPLDWKVYQILTFSIAQFFYLIILTHYLKDELRYAKYVTLVGASCSFMEQALSCSKE